MRIKSTFLLFSFLLSFLPSPAVAADAKPALEGAVTEASAASVAPVERKVEIQKRIRIPVLFVTDRNRIDNGKRPDDVKFGRERQYSGMCDHQPHLGLAWCVIDNSEKKAESPYWNELGWQCTKKDSEGPDGTSVIPGPTYAAIKEGFYKKVYDEAKATPTHEMYVFVPGYMSTFESGLRTAARIGYYSERPVVLYSWPSKGKFTEYMSDEATIEWSQDHFNDMLNAIGEMAKNDPPVHVRLYAHSMGGRLVLRATPLLKSNKAMTEVSVVCPDVDDGLVKHYAGKYFDGSSGLTVRLYESKADKMLKLSQLVHGGYRRFGEDNAPLDTLWTPSAPRTLAPGSIDDSLLHDKPPIDARLLRRMQTIDFTDLDIGTLGHRIPVELLTSLSERGDAGAGWTMIIRKPPKGQKVEGGDGVLKVVSTNKWHHFPLVAEAIRYRPRVRLWITKDWSLR